MRFASDPLLQACLAETTLEAGMVDGAVSTVQQALMELGYGLPDFGPDGVYGDETADAVAAFHADIGAAADDRVVRSRTMAALDERFADEPPEPVVESTVPPAPTRLAPQEAGSGEAAITAAAYASRAVDAALAQAAAGAHFLAGAAGQTPGSDGDGHGRPGVVTLAAACTDPVAPAVFAAQCGMDGVHLCAGRFNARNGGIAGGRPAAGTDTDLIVYLSGLAALPEEQWRPFFQFFSPRRATAAGKGGLVWGEDCRAKQHFDGVGLVNWCLEQAVGARHPIAFDIATWATDASGTEAVALTAPPCKGDILLRAKAGWFTHIGFLVGDQHLDVPADHGHVVLAEQAGVGVVQRRFSPRGWTVRRRPSPALLHG